MKPRSQPRKRPRPPLGNKKTAATEAEPETHHTEAQIAASRPHSLGIRRYWCGATAAKGGKKGR